MDNLQKMKVKSKQSPYRWVILVTVFIAQMAMSAQILISPMGPYIRESLGMSYAQFGLLFTAVNLGSMIMLSFSGFLVDKAGIKTVIMVGQIAVGLILVAASFSAELNQLLFMFFLVGLVQSVGGPLTSKAIVTWFGPTERATAMGIKQAGIPAAGIVAGTLLPPVVISFGWRIGFVVTGIFIAMWGVISFFLYRDSDVMIYIRSSQKQKRSWRETAGDVFKRDIILLSIGCGILLGTQFTYTSYLATFLSEIFTKIGVLKPIVLAGLFYSICNIGGVIGRVSLGLISDRLFGGKRKGTLLITCVIGTIIFFLMAIVVPKINVVGIAIIVFLFGMTGVSFSGIQLSLVSELSGFKASGLATGFTLAVGFAGMMGFPPIFGAIIDNTGGYFWGWIMLGVLSVAGVILILFVKEEKRDIVE